MRTCLHAVACVSVAAAALVAGSPSRADDLTAAQIFQNHDAAVGYSLGDGKMKPYVMHLTTTWLDFKSVTHTERVVRRQVGAIFREDQAYSGASVAIGFDGSSFWHSSPNGALTADDGYSRAFDVTQAVIATESFDASVDPQVRGDQRADAIVRIHPKGGTTADVYFNRSTWYVDEVVVDPDGASLRTEYSDYRSFGPVHIAATRRLYLPSGYLNDIVVTTHVDDVQWGAAIADGDVSAPPSASYATFPSSGSTTVPFDAHRGVIVEASVNGVTGRFAIDTRADGIYVDTLFADKAGILKNKLSRFYLDTPVDLLGMPTATVKIGGLTLEGVKIGVSDFNLYSRETPYDGVLGLDLLSQAVASIDYDKGDVTFTKPAGYETPVSMFPLAITLDGGSAQSDAVTNGSHRVRCELALADAETNIEPLQGGPDITSVKLGPFEEDIHQMAYPFLSSEEYLNSTDAQCIIGYAVLSSMNMVIDYPDLEIYLAAAKRSQ